MSKKQRPPRFRDRWVNQTELGRHFGISAIAVGEKLTELGLRNEQREPSERAQAEEYCRFAPLKDGTPFYLWDKEKVTALFQQAGMSQLSQREVEARTTAVQLIVLAREAEETGIDKLLCFCMDGIPRHDYPLIDRFLRELGSRLRLGRDEEIHRSEPASVLASAQERQETDAECRGDDTKSD